MTVLKARGFACGIAILGTLGSAGSLYAQIGVGTWVRKDAASMTPMTMVVEPCCNGGRRLSYRFDINGTKTSLTLASPFDGSEVPVLINGKPSGETMAIKRIDARHLFTVVKMNGKPFGTSKATLSPDAKLLTVINDVSSSAGGQAVGKTTEVWVKQ
jgi:hypothetical protein